MNCISPCQDSVLSRKHLREKPGPGGYCFCTASEVYVLKQSERILCGPQGVPWGSLEVPGWPRNSPGIPMFLVTRRSLVISPGSKC